MSCNQVTMLPDEIGELKKLKRLDVRMETGHWTSCSNDQMTTSPDEIGKLKELERLQVRMETGHWTSVITSSLQFV